MSSPNNTRADANRLNAQSSTGPRTIDGKAKVSANALKQGFFANVKRLNPNDSHAYQRTLSDLRQGLHPDGPAEEQLISELAMLRARLLRLEAIEYALMCSGIESDPNDAAEVAAAYLNSAPHLDRLAKAEAHLRRAYNKTWDRLRGMQNERKNTPLDVLLKQSQLWATYEAKRTSRENLTAQRHPDLNEKGKFPVYEPGHPMYHPKEADE